MLLGLNLPVIGIWVRLLKVPYHFIALVVVVICIIGAYSVKNAVFDIGMMVFFGIFGYFVRKGGFPPAPLVLALILGPILERSMHQALTTSGGSFLIFVYKPISAWLLVTAGFVMLSSVVRWFWKRRTFLLKGK